MKINSTFDAMKTLIRNLFVIAFFSVLASCDEATPFKFKKLDYKKIVRLLKGQKTKSAIKSDSSNFMDSQEFDPKKDFLFSKSCRSGPPLHPLSRFHRRISVSLSLSL